MPPNVLPRPDPSDARRIKRSRVVSYVLVLVAAVLLSLRPEVFGDPRAEPVHTLLHVWRIVVALLLAAVALAVQVAVGIRWRRNVRRSAESDPATDVRHAAAAEPAPDSTTSEPHGNRAPRDR